jgi:hypothetical protein
MTATPLACERLFDKTRWGNGQAVDTGTDLPGPSRSQHPALEGEGWSLAPRRRLWRRERLRASVRACGGTA